MGLVAYRVRSVGMVLEQSTCRTSPAGWVVKLMQVGEGPGVLPWYQGCPAGFTHFFVHFVSSISLRDFFMSSIGPCHLHRVIFKVVFLYLAALACSGLAVIGSLGSGGATLPFLLLNVFLYWHLLLWVWDDYRWGGRLCCLCWMGVSFL